MSSVSSVFNLRVVIDTEQEVFRDLEIEADSTFESLHIAILNAFGFEGGEMASFYMSNETWEKGLEIPLAGVSTGSDLNMKTTRLSEMLNKPSDKVLYVYDVVRMWFFYVELMEVRKDKSDVIFPRVVATSGKAPSQDAREMDLFGDEFSEDEFNEVHGNSSEDDDDNFSEESEHFNESDMDSSYRDGGY